MPAKVQKCIGIFVSAGWCGVGIEGDAMRRWQPARKGKSANCVQRRPATWLHWWCRVVRGLKEATTILGSGEGFGAVGGCGVGPFALPAAPHRLWTNQRYFSSVPQYFALIGFGTAVGGRALFATPVPEVTRTGTQVRTVAARMRSKAIRHNVHGLNPILLFVPA